MTKKILFSVFCLWCSMAVNSQSITGSWSGDLLVQNMKLPLVLHIEQKGDSLTSTMDSPAQGAKGIVVNKTLFTNNELRIEITAIGASYKGKLDGDSIIGIFTQMGATLPLTLKKGVAEVKSPNRPQMPKPPFNYNIEELSFTNHAEGNTLAGTLTTTKNKKQFPVVVLITGSGAQDRDETLFGHKPFWVIADHLTKNGIGVLRLDDRGVGGSSNGKDGATSADFATDIDAAVNFLRKKGYKNIGLIGHSEGGMIALMVANKNKNVKFIVSMAGPGIPIDELMIGQLKATSKSMNVPEAAANINLQVVQKAYSIMKSYKGNELQKDLYDSLQKAFPLVQSMNKAVSDQVSTPWFSYFLKQNPQQNIRLLKIPVLALNGSKDVQVLSKENLAGWKVSLEKAGNKNFKTVEMEGLNHLFQEAETGSPSEYGQIEQTISPKVLDLVTNWILKLK